MLKLNLNPPFPFPNDGCSAMLGVAVDVVGVSPLVWSSADGAKDGCVSVGKPNLNGVFVSSVCSKADFRTKCERALDVADGSFWNWMAGVSVGSRIEWGIDISCANGDRIDESYSIAACAPRSAF